MTLPELRAALEATCPTQMQTVNGTLMVSLHVPLESLQMVREAAEKHLATLPKTKMVEVWHVEFWDSNDQEPCVSVCADKVMAEARALAIRGEVAKCIRVTGPHQQEVPA